MGGADGPRQGNFHQIRDLQFQETKIADEVYMRVGGVSCPHVRRYEQAPGGGGGSSSTMMPPPPLTSWGLLSARYKCGKLTSGVRWPVIIHCIADLGGSIVIRR